MASTKRKRLRSVSVGLRRLNEYTTWRPRVDRDPFFGAFIWGPVSIDWTKEWR